MIPTGEITGTSEPNKTATRTNTPTQLQVLGKTKDGRDLKVRRIWPLPFVCFADRGFDEGVAGHISPINAPAFAIHSEIHKARPEVNATCHIHSVAGKAFSCFGRELEMITQDALRFYKSHGVYRDFKGVVLDQDEGQRIVAALGQGKAVILQNHGLLMVGESVDEATFWFISLDKTCQTQLLADAAAAAGYKKIVIDEQEAAYAAMRIGGPEKGWLAFQPYYAEQVAETRGEFLQ
ncbi:arad-like aldolase/epimerase [Aspergillus homomorphus CBS 101889]|uniref:Arad-like aldolase/epimerase n=1 Tax=Aspergillus homomorphus (strain CBS 101889) TaxID=1450537 RepID=A0A395HQZ5_ASPHC|nr:arad-like aldolase/epimerase [Aspergillus homomorphus CBS 101889]RAL10016.1 arad-like aldolase/epimerase [Aspergillus homomorphus CBS 101889]